METILDTRNPLFNRRIPFLFGFQGETPDSRKNPVAFYGGKQYTINKFIRSPAHTQATWRGVKNYCC